LIQTTGTLRGKLREPLGPLPQLRRHTASA
jgi:hypothetical protein